MILRKPFAQLIKHFRLIHFIMLLLMIYVTYNTNLVLSFLNQYVASTLVLITHEKFLILFKTSTFVSIAFIFIINLIILGLMWFKKKPLKVYIYNIVAFIYVLVILLISRGLISSLEISLLEIKTIKLIQDLVFSSILVEIVSLVLVIIRTTGFDIKNFDFASDLEGLNINEQDNEEFELNLDVDTDLIRRKVNRGFRYSKYIYVENKYIFFVLFGIIFSFIGGLIYLNMNVYNKKYTENETFKTQDFIITIEDSYVTKYNYRKKLIDENYQFVILRLKLRSVWNPKAILKTGKFALNINDHNLYPSDIYLTEFKDLGINYMKQIINTEFSNYILVYKIPNSYENAKMKIRYFDTLINDIEVKLKPINLNGKNTKKIYNLKEEISLEESILKNSIIKIDSAEISSNFKSDYSFCLNKICTPSYEYIKPKLNTSYDKTLIKLTGKFYFDSNLKISKIGSLYSFIQEFGSISYKIDGKEKFLTNELTEVLPIKSVNKGVTYLEVPKEIETAEEIYLHLNVRDIDYVYRLK